MSGGKLEVGGFYHEVEQFDQFSGDSDECDFGGFSFLAMTLINRFEHAVVLAGGDGGHVKDAPQRGRSVADAAHTLLLAAVAGVGRVGR